MDEHYKNILKELLKKIDEEIEEFNNNSKQTMYMKGRKDMLITITTWIPYID